MAWPGRTWLSTTALTPKNSSPISPTDELGLVQECHIFQQVEGDQRNRLEILQQRDDIISATDKNRPAAVRFFGILYPWYFFALRKTRGQFERLALPVKRASMLGLMRKKIHVMNLTDLVP